jgi:hypothetical protein
MADSKDTVGFEVEVGGVEQSIESIKDLKNAIKAAKDEQIKAAQVYGETSKEFISASQKVGELKDRIDDLNDSTKSLQGSKVESLSSSFSLLGDGLQNLDLDKIKTGFKGIGSAMSAIPLMLIVTGITMLMEKFDIFGKIADAVVAIIYKFTDAIGLTNKADEEFAKSAIENSQKVQKAKEEQYNLEIKLAQAAGQNTKQLELEKLKSIEDSVASQVKALEDLQIKKGKLNDEEQKQYNELQINLLKASGDRQAKEIENEKLKQQQLINLSTLEDKLRVQGLSAREKEIDAIKKQQEGLMVELDTNHKVRQGSEMQDTIRYNEDVKKINEITQKQINEVNAKYRKENTDAINKALEDESDAWWAERLKEVEDEKIYLAEIQKLKDDAVIQARNADKENQAIDNQDALDSANLKVEKDQNDFDAKIALLETQKNIALQNELLTEDGKELIRLEYSKREDALRAEKAAKEKADRDANFERTQSALNSLQALSNAFFDVKRANLTKGSKEEIAAARKQFDINKGIAIAAATISGIQGVINTLSAQSVVPEPFGTALKVLTAAGLAAATVSNISKISSQKFDEGGGGGAGASASMPSTPPMPSPPSIDTKDNNTNADTKFDANGKNLDIKSPTINVNATVGVDEISTKTNRVNTLENQSTF